MKDWVFLFILNSHNKCTTSTVGQLGNSPADQRRRYPNAGTAVVSAAGMDGNDGGWPVLYEPTPVTASTLQLVFEEEQLSDSEREE